MIVLLCFENLLTCLSPAGPVTIPGTSPSAPSRAAATGLDISDGAVQSVRSSLSAATPSLPPARLLLQTMPPSPVFPEPGVLPTHASHNLLFKCHTVYQQQNLLCTPLSCETSHYSQPGRLTLMRTMARLSRKRAPAAQRPRALLLRSLPASCCGGWEAVLEIHPEEGWYFPGSTGFPRKERAVYPVVQSPSSSRRGGRL